MDDAKDRETRKLLILGQNLLLQKRMTNAKVKNPNKSDFIYIYDPTTIRMKSFKSRFSHMSTCDYIKIDH